MLWVRTIIPAIAIMLMCFRCRSLLIVVLGGAESDSTSPRSMGDSGLDTPIEGVLSSFDIVLSKECYGDQLCRMSVPTFLWAAQAAVVARSGVSVNSVPVNIEDCQKIRSSG